MFPQEKQSPQTRSGTKPEGVFIQMQLTGFSARPRALGILGAAFAAVVALAVGAQGASADISNPQLSGGSYNTCAIYPSKRIYCWGSNGSQQLGLGGGNKVSYGTRPYPVKGVKAQPVGISAASSSACALLVTGGVGCWGKNTSGALGGTNSGSYARSFQSSASLISPWVSPSNESTGTQHLCFRDNNATVKCQGVNSLGQLGNGTNTNSNTAVQVGVITGASAATRASQVVSGANHSCALLENKNVKCWGVNNFRQLGSPALSVASSNTPVDVPSLANDITELASMADHTCAVHADDSISCWGADPYGQLGDGTVAPYKGPVSVDGISSARQVSTGISHTCALIAGGAVKCWGSNEFGQLGNGTTTTSAKPVSVIGLARPATEITTGGYHSCARLDTGSIYCWGRGSKGQLGDGSTSSSSTPRRVTDFGGIHFASVSVPHAASSGGSASSDFRATVVALPPRAGKLSQQCRTNAHLTVTIVQDGVTTTKKLRKRFGRSGQTKCSARFSVNGITKSASAATLTLKGSYIGNSGMPGASYTQTYSGL